MNQHRCIVFGKQFKQGTQPGRQHARQLPVNLKHHVACALHHRIIDQHGGNTWVGTHIANNLQMEILDGGFRQAVRVTLTLARAAKIADGLQLQVLERLPVLDGQPMQLICTQ
ncbi:hypothetical protein D3C87_1602620 [compost metagenome]